METIRRFLQSQLVEIFRAFLIVGVAVVVMLRISPRMTLGSLILVPGLFLWAYFFFRLVQKNFQKVDDAEGRMSAVLQENLSGVRVVRALGGSSTRWRSLPASTTTSTASTGTWATCWPCTALQRHDQHGAGRLALIFAFFCRRRAADGGRDDSIRQLHLDAALAGAPAGQNPFGDGKAMVAAGRIADVLETPAEDDPEGTLTPSVAATSASST